MTKMCPFQLLLCLHRQHRVIFLSLFNFSSMFPFVFHKLYFDFFNDLINSYNILSVFANYSRSISDSSLDVKYASAAKSKIWHINTLVQASVEASFGISHLKVSSGIFFHMFIHVVNCIMAKLQTHPLMFT